jgi:hypothetical protein
MSCHSFILWIFPSLPKQFLNHPEAYWSCCSVQQTANWKLVGVVFCVSVLQDNARLVTLFIASCIISGCSTFCWISSL